MNGIYPKSNNNNLMKIKVNYNSKKTFYNNNYNDNILLI
jgi:hypothetical protein